MIADKRETQSEARTGTSGRVQSGHDQAELGQVRTGGGEGNGRDKPGAAARRPKVQKG